METRKDIIKFTPQGAREALQAEELLSAMEEVFGLTRSDINVPPRKDKVLDLVQLLEFSHKHITDGSKSIRLKKVDPSARRDGYIQRYLDVEIPYEEIIDEMGGGELNQLIHEGWVQAISFREKDLEKVVEILQGKGLVLFDPILEHIKDEWDDEEFFKHIHQPLISIARLQDKYNKAKELDPELDIGSDPNLEKLDEGIKGFIGDLLKELVII